MRTFMIASAGAALLASGAASAQRVDHGPGAGYPVPGAAPTARPDGYHVTTTQRSGRWGGTVGGRWAGGANAPGGWNAYRRPYRGWAVPAYWNNRQFYLDDWAGYGLGQPPQGYNWARYYDDAVLIDARGSVYDTVGGVDWDRHDGDAADGYAGGDDVYAGPQDRGHYLPQSRGGYDDHRSNGVGGAVAGAVVGGVAGNLIGGRGNRLGGTLIGAGVGAGVGYAVDRSSGRRAPRPPIARDGAGYPPPPGYGSDYRTGSYGAGYPAPAYRGPTYNGPGPRPGPGAWVSPDGATTVTTTSGGYYGGSSTTVVVQSAPVVTTTTTEIYEDAVTYARPVRKVWHKRVWHPRPKPRCGCR